MSRIPSHQAKSLLMVLQQGQTCSRPVQVPSWAVSRDRQRLTNKQIALQMRPSKRWQYRPVSILTTRSGVVLGDVPALRRWAGALDTLQQQVCLKPLCARPESSLCWQFKSCYARILQLLGIAWTIQAHVGNTLARLGMWKGFRQIHPAPASAPLCVIITCVSLLVSGCIINLLGSPWVLGPS